MSELTGFAAEVAKSKETPNLPVGAGADVSMFNEGMESPEPEAAEAAADEKKETKVKIGDREFSSYEEALAYAEKVEREREIEEAYRQGQEAAKPKEEVQAQKELEDQLEEMLFENPKEAIKLLRQKIKEEILGGINQEKQAEEATKKAWDSFDSSYPDLKKNHELVMYILQTSPELAQLPQSKGFPLIAEKARAMIKSYMEESKPKEVLAKTPVVGVTNTSNGVTFAPPVAEEPKIVDFTSQINKLRKR